MTRAPLSLPRLALCLALALVLAGAALCPAALAEGRSQGQSLYVPLLEYVFLGKRNQPFPLSQTLVVRNTDAKASIILTGVARYDGKGQAVGDCPDGNVTLAPLATWSMGLSETGDKKDPAGSLIITWRSEKPVSPPLVQCILVGSAGQQGISFVVHGKELPPGH